MLDFIWARAAEDEQRATAPGTRDAVLARIARAARMMVRLTRDSPAAGEGYWVQTLQKTAQLHRRHPDYRSEWQAR